MNFIWKKQDRIFLLFGYIAYCWRNSSWCDPTRRDAPSLWFPTNQWVWQIDIPANYSCWIRVPSTNLPANFGHNRGGQWDCHGSLDGHSIRPGNKVATTSFHRTAVVPKKGHRIQYLLVFTPLVHPCVRPPNYTLYVLVPNQQTDGKNGKALFLLMCFYILINYFTPW